MNIETIKEKLEVGIEKRFRMKSGNIYQGKVLEINETFKYLFILDKFEIEVIIEIESIESIEGIRR